MKEAVTCVDVVKYNFGNKFIIFSGLEDGTLNILLFNNENKEVKIIYDWNIFLQFGKCVKKIQSFVNEDNKIIRIGSCSEDFTVRIFDIDLNDLIKFIENK